MKKKHLKREKIKRTKSEKYLEIYRDKKNEKQK